MERALAQDEPRIVLSGVSFDEYSALRDAFDRPSLRMTYCEGVLELMSPSNTHERWKSSVGRLLEHYVFFLDIPVNAHGSTTFRKRASDRGVEPDECYVVRRLMPEGGVPDIAIEVVYSKPAIDKLKVYDGLLVPEVWFFDARGFTVHCRKARGGYRKVAKSGFLPDVDLALLARLVLWEDQHAAAKELARCVSR